MNAVSPREVNTLINTMRRRELRQNELLVVGLAILLAIAAPCCSAVPRPTFTFSSQLRLGRMRTPSLRTIELRGGSAAVMDSEYVEDDSENESDEEDAVEVDEESRKEQETLRNFRLTQNIYLQSRSIVLRSALIERGLTELALSDTSSKAVAKDSDWDCALATTEHPKSCMISIDAVEGSKVVAPTNSTKWITVSNLNRLRRDEPSKVNLLWNSQYNALQNWFGPGSPYAFSTHMPPLAAMFVSGLLDRPWLLKSLLLSGIALGFIFTLPWSEFIIGRILLLEALWTNWRHWALFTHAALPLKLFFFQVGFAVVGDWFSRRYNFVRAAMVEWECDLLQDCVPLTIVEEEEVLADYESI